jgi:hypothetical protein
MAKEFERGKVTARSDDKVEVKVGSRSVIVEQSELHNLSTVQNFRRICFERTVLGWQVG